MRFAIMMPSAETEKLVIATSPDGNHSRHTQTCLNEKMPGPMIPVSIPD
jgi:hypothetical protein